MDSKIYFDSIFELAALQTGTRGPGHNGTAQKQWRGSTVWMEEAVRKVRVLNPCPFSPVVISNRDRFRSVQVVHMHWALSQGITFSKPSKQDAGLCGGGIRALTGS